MDNYVTEEKLGELRSELETLKTTMRAQVAKQLKRAKELGDLSENSEYLEAREEQRKLEMHIGELEELIKNARIITKHTSANIIEVGSTIRVSKNDQEFVFTIVGPNESHPQNGLISNESPLGAAFLGRKKGDIVKIITPGGEAMYKVVSLE